MNIIVSSLTTNGIKIVNHEGGAVDIDKIKVYSAKSINIRPVEIELVSNGVIDEDLISTPTYRLLLNENSTLEKNNYLGYDVSCSFAIPSQAYTATIVYSDNINSTKIDLPSSLTVFNDLEDEHKEVIINDRTISKIESVIVAQDYHSQQIRFLIKEHYDGISFIDSHKKIYVDYIPVNFKPYIAEDGSKVNFLSSQITEINKVARDGQNWLILKWDVPYTAVENAGNVKFAISVVNLETPMYIWQTMPSTFTVQPNLAVREGLPIVPEENSNALTDALARIGVLEDFVEDIDNISSIDPETGTVTYISREDGQETESTYSIFGLGTTDDDEFVIVAGDSDGGNL